jgi:small ligand-binding sensory domain FIST
MKLFPTGHATHPQWRMAAALVLAQLRAQMSLPEYASAPTLGLLYITDHYASEAQALFDYLSSELPEVTDWSGTVGVGVSASNAEYFDEPALSVMLLDVPADQYRVFSGVAPLPRNPASGFEAYTALVHADGHTAELAELLDEMAARTATGYLFGGLSASRSNNVQFAVGGDGNMAGQGGASGVFDGGLSGVAFGAGVALVSRVTQGCQPVGVQHTITAAHENVVLQLDGEPALDVLLDTLEVSLDGGDPQPALRKVRATLAGLVNAGEQPQGQRRTGHFGTDTRVRHIVGLDATRRGVALADHVETRNAPDVLPAQCGGGARRPHAHLRRNPRRAFARRAGDRTAGIVRCAGRTGRSPWRLRCWCTATDGAAHLWRDLRELLGPGRPPLWRPQCRTADRAACAGRCAIGGFFRRR